MCLFAIHLSSVAKCLLNPPPIFKNWAVYLLSRILCTFWIQVFLSDTCFENILSQSVACFFIVLTVLFLQRGLFTLDKVQFINLFFVGQAFGVISK